MRYRKEYMIGIERTSQEVIFTKKTLSDDYERSDYVKDIEKKI